MSVLETGTLYYGDCLDWMQRWDDRCVDLIYLDPPFNSKADYNMLYSNDDPEGDAQYRAFSDTWTWDKAAADRFRAYEGALGRSAHGVIVGLHRILGPSGMLAYLTYMAERLEHMHRLLKPSGAIYLHCDPTASHYLKVIMDAVFGAENFQNEIIWRRTGAHGKVQRYAPIHDTLLFYSRSKTYKWSHAKKPYMQGHVDEFFVKDSKGYKTNYFGNVLTGHGRRGGESGKPWKGIDPTVKNRHWAIPRSLLNEVNEDLSSLTQHQKLDRLYDLGLIKIVPGQTWPMYERYITPNDGYPIPDIWAYQPYTRNTVFGTDDGIDEDVRWLSTKDKERLGYPTQKPVDLLDRIIKASSDEGDVVLDPFCGCGTTIEAAQNLNRRWVGIDISSFAIDLILDKRLKDRTIPTKGIPTDLASARKLAAEKPFDFESWAVTRMPGFRPNTKKVADGGVDGRAILATKPDNYDSRLALAQIKGGKFSLSTLRDFIHVTHRDKAALGCYVTLDPVTTKAATTEIVNTGKISVAGYPYPRMQVWPVADYFEQRLPNLPIMNDPYSGKPMMQGTLF